MNPDFLFIILFSTLSLVLVYISILLRNVGNGKEGYNKKALSMPPHIYSHSSLPQKNELFKDIADGEVDKIKAAVSTHPSLSHLCLSSGKLPIVTAIQSRQLDVVEAMLDLGFDTSNGTGDAVINEAILISSSMFNLLIRKGIQITDPERALLSAVEQQNRMIVSYIIKQHPKTDTTRALFYAVSVNNDDICALLLKQGADPNRGSPAPLAIAALNENILICKLLLESQAQPDGCPIQPAIIFNINIGQQGQPGDSKHYIKSNPGETSAEQLEYPPPLFITAAAGNYEIYQLLIDYGANTAPVFVNDRQITLYSTALRSKNLRVIFSAFLHSLP